MKATLYQITGPTNAPVFTPVGMSSLGLIKEKLFGRDLVEGTIPQPLMTSGKMGTIYYQKTVAEYTKVLSWLKIPMVGSNAYPSAALYSDNNGSPGDVLAITKAGNYGLSVEYIPLETPYAVTAGMTYWIAVYVDYDKSLLYNRSTGIIGKSKPQGGSGSWRVFANNPVGLIADDGTHDICVSGYANAPIIQSLTFGTLNTIDIPPEGYCTIPDSDTYYSYPIILCVKYESIPINTSDYTFSIQATSVYGPGNIKKNWFTDKRGQAYPDATGRVVIGKKNSGNAGFLITEYEQPQGIPGVSGYAIKDPVYGFGPYKTQTVVDLDTINAGNPLQIDTGIQGVTRPVGTWGYTRAFAIQAEILPPFDTTKLSITIGVTTKVNESNFY